jgi:hypothetical protein
MIPGGIFRLLSIALSTVATIAAAESGKVMLIRTPAGGIQPQAAVDSSGTVHLIYYNGAPGEGDIFYVRRGSNESRFSSPIRVNSQTGSAIAAGSIRGAQLAVGAHGRVHVAWDGMGKGARPEKFNDKEVTPLFYTRLNAEGTAFEPERNLITYAYGLDGGSSVAADNRGNVYVVWHGRAPGSKEGEAGRAVFVARSQDEGKTFSRESPAVADATGACACCGMRAFADTTGKAYILFRAATEGTERGETLLVSPWPGADFQVTFSHPWKATICPMSSAAISESNSGALLAWETGNDVYFASVDPKTMKVSTPLSPGPGPKRKHPVVVGNGQGETLFAWTEGTAWAKGGDVAWQVFDRNNQPTEVKGHAEAGVPVWSLLSAVPKPNGDFLLFY